MFNYVLLSKQFRVLIVLVTLSVLWGSSFLAIKVVIDSIPPILGFGIRFAASGAILLAIYTFHTGNKKVEHIGIRRGKMH
jgi:drug/metabolite transporter (DMT)-like permease